MGNVGEGRVKMPKGVYPGNKGKPKYDVVRKSHTLRAYDDEWEQIRSYAKQLKRANDAKKREAKAKK